LSAIRSSGLSKLPAWLVRILSGIAPPGNRIEQAEQLEQFHWFVRVRLEARTAR
jgi:hypothetical protein